MLLNKYVFMSGLSLLIVGIGVYAYSKLANKEIVRSVTPVTQVQNYQKDVSTSTSLSFLCGVSTVKDTDGNVYETVAIGNQCWMKQNMRVGKRIDITTKQSNNNIIEKYCFSDIDSNCTDNHPNHPDGGLYNWDEAMQYSTSTGAQGMCPAGWHIPTFNQFAVMERAICTSTSCASDFTYDIDNIEDTTSIGFRGTNEGVMLQPNGSSKMEINLNGGSIGKFFHDRGSMGSLWSSTEVFDSAWILSLSLNGPKVWHIGSAKDFGHSVRCLKD